MRNDISVAWAIQNSVVILCFTSLAIYFNHWWIALFSVFFIAAMQTKVKGVVVTCDGCGKTLYATSWDAVCAKAKRAGWIRRKNGDEWEDFCRECQRKEVDRLGY